MPRPTPNIWPFSSFKRSTITHLRSGVRSTSNLRYKGYMIYKRGPDEFEVPQLDSSIFESQKEAKRFIDSQVRRNPGMHSRTFNAKYEAKDFVYWLKQNKYTGIKLRPSGDGRHIVYYDDPKPKGHVLIIKNPAPWFEACVKGVKAKGGAYDPQAVCGAVLRRKRGRGNPGNEYDWTSTQAKKYFDSLSDAKLSKRLDLIHAQQRHAYEQKQKGTAVAWIDEIMDNLAQQEQAVIDARMRKWKY